MSTHPLSLGRRLPVIRQTEAAECGLACLAMIAAWHGHARDLGALRRQFPVSSRGLTLAQLMRIADAMQLIGRPLRVELADLQRLALPCVLHWDFNHFVVLHRVRGRSVEIHDPARGALCESVAEASRHFTGVALELSPGPHLPRRDERRRIAIWSLLGRVRGVAHSAAQVLLLALALEFLVLLAPALLQWTLDGAIVNADRDLLAVIVFGGGLLVLLREALALLRSRVLTHLAASVTVQWSTNLFQHLLRLPASYFAKRHLGDLVSRFESLHAIQRTVTTGFLEAILDGCIALLTLAMMLFYSVSLATLVIGCLIGYALSRAAALAATRRSNEEQIVAAARQASCFLESLRGIRSLKLNERTVDRASQYFSMAIESANRGVRAQNLASAMRGVNGVLFGLQNAGVLAIGALAVIDAQITVGMLLAFMAYKDQFTHRSASLVDRLMEWRLLRLHADRLADIALEPPEEMPQAASICVPAAASCGAPAIEARGLSYRYADHEPWVLDGVDFVIGSGESVAIVGESGSGKSTLAQLLVGLLRPNSGTILVDGQRLESLGMSAYRAMLGAVLQDDQLFAGSIADNIAMFEPAYDMSRVIAAARSAAIHDEISALPMGYHTLVGDMGAALSGGQRQRLLIARALCRQPRLLVLDEATSALDLANERRINAAIRALRITRILIAHRPETIAAADRVITLRSGRAESATGRADCSSSIR